MKGGGLLACVAVAWAVTVVGMTLMAFLFWAYLGLLVLLLSLALWLLPLMILPKGPGRVAAVAPVLLCAVPVVLASSTYQMISSLNTALIYRQRADYMRRTSGDVDYVRTELAKHETKMAEVGEGFRISLGGGALAALLEILALYCWTRRTPAHRWGIAVVLAAFGSAVRVGIYALAAVGFPLTA